MNILQKKGVHAVVLAALASSALLSACVVEPARGRYYGGVDVEVAPPPDRVVIAPAVRRGYIWAPGYYRWTGHQHVWVEGRYMHERRGYHWAPAHWEQRNGRYHFDDGHWVR